MTAEALLNKLERDTKDLVDVTEQKYLALDDVLLNYKSDEITWSILECFEHLNRYSRYYNKAITQGLRKAATGDATHEIKFSWLGGKFIDMMGPGNSKKQKTPRHMNPSNSALTVAAIHEYLDHQIQFRSLLLSASGKDITRKAIPVEFFRLLRISIADSLKFVVVHQQRHFLQLERLLTQARAAAVLVK